MAQHDDTNERRKQDALRKIAELDEADIDETFRVLLTLPKGRKALWWLMQIGKIGVNPFAGERNLTDFQCGELNVGQQIQARMMQVNPDGYVNMLKERQAEYEQRNDLLSRVNSGDDLYANGGDPNIDPNDASG